MIGYSQPRGGWASRGPYPSRGYARGGRSQVHRNRTLVLNSTSIAPASTGIVANNIGDAIQPLSAATVDSPSWVTKTDRHLQLINTSVFGEESQRRAKAMEETRKLKLKQREDIEKLKLSKHLYRMGANNGYNAQPQSGSGNYEINVQGIQFQVVKDGSKLVKIPGELLNKIRGSDMADYFPGLNLFNLGDSNAAKATPKVAMVGGVKFHRSKNGNMFRAGIVKAHRYGRPVNAFGKFISTSSKANTYKNRRTGVVKKINEPCKMFSTTGNPFLSKKLYWHYSATRRTVWVSANSFFTFRFMLERPTVPLYPWPYKGRNMQRVSSKVVMSKWKFVWPFTWPYPWKNSLLLALCERKLFQLKLPLRPCQSFTWRSRLQTIWSIWLLWKRVKLRRAPCSWMSWLQ